MIGPPAHFVARCPRRSQTLSQVVAPQLFAASLFPYLAFLFYLTRHQRASGAPPLMVGGFWFLLAFVFATIPAGA